MMRTGTAVILLVVLSAITGCGFEPLHGRNERAARVNQMESVLIVTDNTRQGQLLKAEIQDQVNPTGMRAEKPFMMKITVTEVEAPVFINIDGTSSRGDMQYSSIYVLTRISDGKVIDSGSISRISSYNISENADYATFVSREDARKRGILELAQDYKLRMATLLPTLNTPLKAAPAESVEPAAAPIIRLQDNHEDRTTGF